MGSSDLLEMDNTHLPNCLTLSFEYVCKNVRCFMSRNAHVAIVSHTFTKDVPFVFQLKDPPLHSFPINDLIILIAVLANLEQVTLHSKQESYN